MSDDRADAIARWWADHEVGRQPFTPDDYRRIAAYLRRDARPMGIEEQTDVLDLVARLEREGKR